MWENSLSWWKASEYGQNYDRRQFLSSKPVLYMKRKAQVTKWRQKLGKDIEGQSICILSSLMPLMLVYFLICIYLYSNESSL